MTSDIETEYTPDQDDLDNPCQICNGIYDGVVSMVQCSACKLWNHHKCVGNPVVSEKEWWACPKCVKAGKETGALPKNPNSSVRNVQKPRNEVNAPLASKISKLEKLMASQQELLNQLIANRKPTGDEATSRERGGKRHERNRSDQNLNSQSENRKPSNGKQGRSKTKTINRRSKYFESSDSESDEPESISSRVPRYSGKQLSKYIAQQEMRELPIFDGSPTQWPVFYNKYTESKELFSDVTNRNRLQKALKGKALKAVAGLLLSPSTIDDAIYMLEYRFGQNEQIIQEAIDHAMTAEQPNEKKPESIVDYAMLILTIKVNIEAVGDEAEMMNPMLIKSLAQRLPYELQKKWNRKKRECKENDKLVKISTFSKWLMNESQDYVGMLSSGPRESKETKRSVHLHQHSEENNVPVKSTRRVCFKCSDENHQLAECVEFRDMSWPERRRFVHKNNICFVCLKRGHRLQRCYMKKQGIHKLLSDPKLDSKANEATTAAIADTGKVERAMTHHRKDEKMLFKIIPVVLHGPVSQVRTFALLDDCASVTLIDQDVANKLQLTGVPEPLLIGWTSNIKNLVKDSIKVHFDISGIGVDNKKFRIKNARTVSNLSLPCQNLDAEELSKKYQYLRDADITSLASAFPTILIGIDNANLIAPLETKIDPKEVGPVAIKTKLGWSIHGPEAHMQEREKIYPTFVICECSVSDQTTHNLVEKYFLYEDFGVQSQDKC